LGMDVQQSEATFFLRAINTYGIPVEIWKTLRVSHIPTGQQQF